MKPFASQIAKMPPPASEAEGMARVRRLNVYAEDTARKRGLPDAGRELVKAVEAAAVELVQRYFNASRRVAVRQLSAEQMNGPVLQVGGRFAIPPGRGGA